MKPKNIKLAIFDIDGTLIIRGKQLIEPSAVRAIQRLKEADIEVMIATGRAFYFIQDDIRNTLKPDYTVTINGACTYDVNQSVIYKVPMKREEVNAVLQYCREHDLGVALKCEQAMHVYHDMPTFTTTYLQGSPKVHVLKDYTQAPLLAEGDEIPMGMFLMGDEALIEKARPLCQDGYFSHAYKDAYDIYSKRAGKIRGIEVVLKRLGLDWEETIAFGDADNDRDMLKHAQIGVAMGNAPQSVKDSADHVTAAIDEDGIEKALIALNLI